MLFKRTWYLFPKVEITANVLFLSCPATIKRTASICACQREGVTSSAFVHKELSTLKRYQSFEIELKFNCNFDFDFPLLFNMFPKIIIGSSCFITYQITTHSSMFDKCSYGSVLSFPKASSIRYPPSKGIFLPRFDIVLRSETTAS